MVLKPDLGQWIDVKKNPIPQGHPFDYFIVTDGSRVETSYTRKYNSRGELVMGYTDGEKLVKYWRPLPSPPTNSGNIGS